jgi:type IV pilus assembly protein PilQ
VGTIVPVVGATTPTNLPATVSLEFESIDIRKALQILAKFIGVNIVLGESVQGKVSINLSQVAAEEAMQTILHMHGLTHKRIGNTWIIQPQNKSATSQGSSPQLETKRIILKYREAKDIAALFLGNSTTTIKPEYSELSVDTHSNSLWVQDTPERIQKLEQLVEAFDHPIKQILIEARIVSINRGFENVLGSRLGLKPSSENLSEASNNLINTYIPSLNIDLPGDTPITFGIPLFWKGGQLDLELSAMESEGNGHIISSPHLITSDRQEAIIEAGSEIPYQEKGRYGNTLIFKKAVLSLKVVPEVTSLGNIVLKLHLNHNTPGTIEITDGGPPINTQELKTQVVIQPGETVVLGGIYETVQQKNSRGLPFLRKVPLLKTLFARNSQTDKTNELLIFITPRLLSDTLTKLSTEIKQSA